MPDLTVTLTDEQWAAYQAVNNDISLDGVSAWLKSQLTTDYQRKLEVIDEAAAHGVSVTASIARATKIEAF